MWSELIVDTCHRPAFLVIPLSVYIRPIKTFSLAKDWGIEHVQTYFSSFQAPFKRAQHGPTLKIVGDWVFKRGQRFSSAYWSDPAIYRSRLACVSVQYERRYNSFDIASFHLTHFLSIFPTYTHGPQLSVDDVGPLSRLNGRFYMPIPRYWFLSAIGQILSLIRGSKSGKSERASWAERLSYTVQWAEVRSRPKIKVETHIND